MEAKVICDGMLNNGDMKWLPLYHVSARNGQALSLLLMAETLDEAFTLRDPARMVVTFIEQWQQHLPGLALTMAHLIFGAARSHLCLAC